jgi:hypothetical protein
VPLCASGSSLIIVVNRIHYYFRRDGKQLSGFFISVQIMLDMVDAGNDIDVLYSMNQFKAVCPDFAPSEVMVHLFQFPGC